MPEPLSQIADARVLGLGAGYCSFVKATLREVARVLAPRGRFFLAVGRIGGRQARHGRKP